MTTVFAYTQLLRNHWPMLLFGLMTVFWGNLGQSFFFSWYGPYIQQDFGLSASVYGAVYSAATLGSSFLLLMLGGVIDRLPLRCFIAGVSLFLFAAAAMLGAATTLPVLAVSILLLRFCGQGLMPHTAMTTMARYFNASRGKGISVANTGEPLGEMLLPLLVVALIGWVGWQASWYWLALSIPLIYLPLAWWLLGHSGAKDDVIKLATKAPHPVSNSLKDASRRTVLSDPRFWRALPLLLLAPFAITGVFIQFGFIVTERNWSPTLLASAFVVYGSFHWGVSIWVGNLVDQFTASRMLSVIALPLIVAFCVATLVSAPWAVWIMMAGLGAGNGCAGPITNALWAEIYGKKHLGSIRSLITAIMVMSTAAAPVLLGLLIDRGVTVEGFFITLLMISLTTGLLSWRAYTPRQEM